MSLEYMKLIAFKKMFPKAIWVLEENSSLFIYRQYILTEKKIKIKPTNLVWIHLFCFQFGIIAFILVHLLCMWEYQGLLKNVSFSNGHNIWTNHWQIELSLAEREKNQNYGMSTHNVQWRQIEAVLFFEYMVCTYLCDIIWKIF